MEIKTEINKSATMRELRKEAKKEYEHSWLPELKEEAFMKGAETLLKILSKNNIKERDLTEDIKRIDSEEQITKWFCKRNHIKKEELDKYHRYAIATALKYIKEQEL